MPRFRIPIVFTALAAVEIEAADYEEARLTAYADSPLPPKSEWEYLDCSFHVRGEDPYEIQDPETGKWETCDSNA